MDKNAIMKLIVEDMHTSVMATIDENGYPVTAAIDIMDYDADGLYFLTATGKSLYKRLSCNEHIAITLLKGNDTMHTLAVSLKGCAREIGPERLPSLFEKNPYMFEIYRNEDSRRALTVFQIYEGTGEFFNIDGSNIERTVFELCSGKLEDEGYYISESCISCGACTAVCPREALSLRSGKAEIDQMHCIRCGNCKEICPVEAVRFLCQ